MPDTEAFILPPRNPATAPVRLERRSLCERAILALRRGGIERIVVSSECRFGVATLRRFARLHISLLTRESAMISAIHGRRLVVVSADVVFEPAAVSALVDTLASHNLSAVAAAGASPGTFAAFTPDAAESLHGASDRDILDRVDTVRVASLDTAFCRAIVKPGDAAAVQRSYRNHINRAESVTTRLARLFSRVFFRVRMSAN